MEKFKADMKSLVEKAHERSLQLSKVLSLSLIIIFFILCNRDFFNKNVNNISISSFRNSRTFQMIIIIFDSYEALLQNTDQSADRTKKQKMHSEQ